MQVNEELLIYLASSHAKIMCTELPEKCVAKLKIDWGKSKKQGKRTRHMVTGAMASVLTGVHTYQGIDWGYLNLTKDEESDIKGLSITQCYWYLKARINNFSHYDSMVYTMNIAKIDILSRKQN